MTEIEIIAVRTPMSCRAIRKKGDTYLFTDAMQGGGRKNTRDKKVDVATAASLVLDMMRQAEPEEMHASLIGVRPFTAFIAAALETI